MSSYTRFFSCVIRKVFPIFAHDMEIIEGIKLCVYFVMMAIVWIIGIMMAYAALVLVLSLFWKGEVGKEARKSCLAHILILIVPGFLFLVGNAIYRRCDNKEPKEKPARKQVKSSLYSTPSSSDFVYICTGPYSTRYHESEDCISLSRCSEDIEELSLEEAEEQGYEPCKRCFE